MALIRWAPYDLSDNLDEVVRRTFGDFGSSLLAGRNQMWSPRLDAFVEGEQLRVRLELPGIDPDADVEIEVENGVLRVSGERKAEQRTEENGWVRREMTYGSFDRRIGLPEGIDAENVQASYDAGVLDITIPLPTKPKTKVKVDVGTQKQLKN